MKTVLISGATGALGSVVHQTFESRGWQVVTIQSPRPDRLAGSHTLLADITDEIQTAGAVQELLTRFGGLDAVLLLVGGFEGGGLENSDGGSLRRMFTLNVESAYNVLRPVMLHWRTSGRSGRAVLVGAAGALDAETGRSNLAYAWSKASLMPLAAMLNKDNPDIRTAVLLPGTIDTPANRSYSSGADHTEWDKPADLAEAPLDFAEGRPVSGKLMVP